MCRLLAKRPVQYETYSLENGNYETEEDFTAELKQKISDHKLESKVKFLGFLNSKELDQAFNRANVIVFPSTYDEPFGRSAIEGMAAGLTLLTSGTGGQGEIIDDGNNGLLFEAENPGQLAQKLESLMNDKQKWRAISAQGREDAYKYTIYASVDIIENFFQTIIREANIGPSELVTHRAKRRKDFNEQCQGTLTMARDGKEAEALDILKNISAETMSLFPAAHLYSGRIYMEKGDFEKAVNCFMHMVMIEPFNWQGHFYMGEAFQKGGLFKMSLPHYERAFERFPANRIVRKALIDIYRKCGENEKADELEKA